MPWLEVPDWRAWQPYARPMSDTPDDTPTTFTVDPPARVAPPEVLEMNAAAEAALAAEEPAPDEQLVITGTIDMVIDPVELGLAPAPDIDDVLAGNVPGDDPSLDGDEDGTRDETIEEAIAAHPSGRFPVENEPERIDPPAASRLPAEVPVEHLPVTATETDDERERRIEKESMSRAERRRRGW